MISFLKTLKIRNRVLYYFGLINLICGLISMLMTTQNDTIVLGINAWIKPMKFYFSIAIFCWTMAWFMYYLNQQRKVSVYSWMVVTVMVYEMFVITWQAANGRLSHFNVSNSFYALLFTFMGIFITILTFWTGYIGYLFFRQKQFTVPMRYIWGIRLGIIIFVIFSLEGGLMAQRLSHTVGAPDGSPGLPIINWSRMYGDLRVAHFFGMHSLQILPLVGYYFANNKKQVFIFAGLYFIMVAVFLVQALIKIPLI